MNRKKTAVEVYLSTVFKWGLIILVSACMCATVMFNTEKLFGLYPTVPWIATIGLGIMDSTFFVIAILIIKSSFDQDGNLKEGRLQVGKVFSVVVLVIQWNYLLYMLPTRTFWGFLFFFLILMAFFLDMKMLLISGLACMGSLFIGWFIRGTDLLPVKDELFLTDILMCLVALTLSLTGLLIFVFFVAHFLVNAKKDELEKNNERVQNMLYSVSELSEKLGEAGGVLSTISSSESASAEELSATSETLLINNTKLREKSDNSIENLSELQNWETVVSEHVDKVEGSSKELLEQSRENSQKLHSLKAINAEVSASMDNTNKVAQRLSDAVQEIGVTLNIISDISESTNLLALNASIEAARAGEVGKGFAVVASEVGHLANDTRDSLGQVAAVIEKVQQNVADMINFVKENTEKLEQQNEYFNDVFAGIQEMINILNNSISDIGSMGDAHNKQSEVIKSTVAINEDIAESIRQENIEFSNINGMVEGNTSDVVKMTEQVAVLNQMVDQINKLLSME